nr:hypothetical protein [Candidatus Methanofastidiosa archaeon]
DIGLEKEVGAVIDTTTVVGVSKRSVLSTINGRVPDMWLPLGACEYREVPEDKLNKMVEERNLIEDARTVYARFHENGPCLRMDIAGDVGRALAISRHYSFYNICPGYPFPLAEIHRLVCMDDKRGIYENMLRAEMEKGGMGAVYLKGRIVNERETGSFHSTLDGLV